MKNIILATALLVALGAMSFTGEKNTDKNLLNELSTTLKSSLQVHWTSKEEYSKATFNFNGKTASAFYASDNELLGFSIKFNPADLPAVVSDGIKNKYGDWSLTEAIIFIDAAGYINYYARVEKNNKSLAIKISPDGDVSMFSRIYN